MLPHLQSHRGQAMVEFALVAPIFFLLLFAIIEGGRFIFYYETLNNATREGARYAIVNGENSLDCPTGPSRTAIPSCDEDGGDVIEHVRDAAIGMPGSAIIVIPVWSGTSPATNGRGSTITVTASFTYSSLIPIVPLPPITVEAESSLVINN